MNKIELNKEQIAEINELKIEKEQQQKEFEDRLNTHDWQYQYSDDSRVYSYWSTNESELINLARAIGPDALQLFYTTKETNR